MGPNIVTELIDSYPTSADVRQVHRNEELLLRPLGAAQVPFLRDHSLLKAITFPVQYFPSKFAPPVGIFESNYVRVEWQKMSGRQPFYHRNADVDEISYHVSGERTLISEKGSVDLQVGDFARIPVTVAHDNRGLEDIHYLFYIPAPVVECVAPSRKTTYKSPPFTGWEPNPQIVEVMTECLAAMGCDISATPTDESLILEAAHLDPDPIQVLRAQAVGDATAETEWLYKSAHIWLGSTTLKQAKGTVYKRHRCADEIQCQVGGRRTLVTQRGMIDLEPGDFISIPLGTAFTSVSHGDEECTYLTVLTRFPAEPKKDASKSAKEVSFQAVAALRNS